MGPADPHQFQHRLAALDTSIFAPILSQTTDADRASLLALQGAVRRRLGSYVYLEIGSYLGGTLQPHIQDPSCRKIYSIDKRPPAPPDERDGVCVYDDNSTEHMLSLLRAQAPDQMHKLQCFDSDAQDLSPAAIDEPPDLCFIDGEHTNRAVLSDFAFCLRVCKRDAVIVFHDAARTYLGLRQIHRECQRPHTGIKLGGSVYAILLGAADVAQDPHVQRMARSGPIFLRLMQLRAFYQARIPSSVRTRLKPLLRPISSQLPR